MHVRSEVTSPRTSEAFEPSPGDLIVTCRRKPIWSDCHCAIGRRFSADRNLAAIRWPWAEPQYVEMGLSSARMQTFMDLGLLAPPAQPHFTLAQSRGIEGPIPPLDRKSRLRERLIDSMRHSTGCLQLHVAPPARSAHPQTVSLARAFSGRLVAQDPQRRTRWRAARAHPSSRSLSPSAASSKKKVTA